MPVKRAEPKPVKCPDDFGARLKVVEHQSDEVVLNSTESSNDVELGSIPKEIVSTEENNGVGRPNQCQKKNWFWASHACTIRQAICGVLTY